MSGHLIRPERARRQALPWWMAGIVVALLWLQHAAWAHAVEHLQERRSDHAVSTAVCAVCVAHAALDCLPDTIAAPGVAAPTQGVAAALPWRSVSVLSWRHYQPRAPPGSRA